ncbi:MAG: dihydroorotase [Bacteroidia bacterium]|nr:dihydroorotase [Bacteroidia bacterium]
MVTLLKHACLLERGSLTPADILIDDSRIVDIAAEIVPSNDIATVHLGGCFVSYGFADLHVHLREPGFSSKETIRTGSLAAAAGGYTTVCAMPNLNPVPDSPETLALEQEIIDRDAAVQVLPYASITKERKGLELVDMAAMKGRCCAFSDDGSGVQSEGMMRAAMTLAAREDCIIAAHCEDNTLLHGGYIHDGRWCAAHGHKGICSESEWGQIARDLKLAAETGVHYHVCHISTKESVDLIRKAKAAGVNVTCETGPHYLVLCEDDLREDGRFKMNPPLRSAEDRAALIEGLQDGTIDVIATDHAPHTAEQKSRGLEGSAMGIVGLETAFPVLYTKLVRTGVITLEKLVDLMCAAPRRIFNLGGSLEVGQEASLTVIDLNAGYRIDSGSFKSLGHSTPFDGWDVYGKVVRTMYRGKFIEL